MLCWVRLGKERLQKYLLFTVTRSTSEELKVEIVKTFRALVYYRVPSFWRVLKPFTFTAFTSKL
jgi:hypothetical protein